MKLPGPDHPITITANPKRVRVLVDGVVIAETGHALTLKEASYPAVQYVPRADARMDLMTPLVEAPTTADDEFVDRSAAGVRGVIGDLERARRR